MPDSKAIPEQPNTETEEVFSDNELSASEMEEYHKWLEEEQQNADMFLNTNNIHVENTVFYGYCQ